MLTLGFLVEEGVIIIWSQTLEGKLLSLNFGFSRLWLQIASVVLRKPSLVPRFLSQARSSITHLFFLIPLELGYLIVLCPVKVTVLDVSMARSDSFTRLNWRICLIVIFHNGMMH